MYKIAKENYKKYSELLHKYKSWLLIRTGKRKITKKKIKNNMDIVLYNLLAESRYNLYTCLQPVSRVQK